MARLFARASGQSLVHSTTAVNFTTTMSVSCWYYASTIPSSDGTVHTLISKGRITNANDRNFDFDLRQISGEVRLNCTWTNPANTFVNYHAAFTPSTNTWYQLTWTIDWSTNPDSVHLYERGADTSLTLTGSNNLSPTTTATQQLRVAGLHSASDFWDGRLAEIGIWNVVLTSGEAKALASGTPPNMVRRDSLVHYWPLLGIASPETNYTATAEHLTLSNTPTAAGHPTSRIFVLGNDWVGFGGQSESFPPGNSAGKGGGGGGQSGHGEKPSGPGKQENRRDPIRNRSANERPARMWLRAPSESGSTPLALLLTSVAGGAAMPFVGPALDTLQGYQRTSKELTFTGASGMGESGTNVTVFTVTGEVEIAYLVPFCTSNLTESAPTSVVSLGVTSATTLFVGNTNAVEIDTGEFWYSATPSANGAAVPDACKEVVITDNVIVRPTTQNVSGGSLRVTAYWRPLSSDGNLVVA